MIVVGWDAKYKFQETDMKLIFILLISGVLALGGLKLFSRKLLYFPQPLELSRLEDLKTYGDRVKEWTLVRSEDVTLHGWIIEKDRNRLPLIFYFGGNAEEVSLNIEQFLEKLEANVVLVNYRGYGKSSGSPSEDGLKADALAIHDALVKDLDIPREKTLAWGRSLGSSMAAFLARERGLGGLVLTCPFDAIDRVAADFYPGWLVGLVLKDRHNTIDFSPGIESRTLVLAASDDEVISAERTRTLYDSLTCPKKMVIIEGAGHNMISEIYPYYESLGKFLEKEFARPGTGVKRAVYQ